LRELKRLCPNSTLLKAALLSILGKQRSTYQKGSFLRLRRS
jgi:hypothetical protein